MPQKLEIIIASGPVIIEDNKVLLNKEQKDYGITPWLFPGGRVENFDQSLEETCQREVKEKMGIEIKIIKPLRTLLAHINDKTYILVHYLAERVGEIKSGADVVEWNWHDINNLPDDCAENVYEIINDFLNEKI